MENFLDVKMMQNLRFGVQGHPNLDVLLFTYSSLDSLNSSLHKIES